MNPSLVPVIRAVRRRLRAAWAIATTQLAAPLVAATALVLVALGRFFDMSWSEPAAVGVVVAAALVIVTGASMLRVPDIVVARAADKGLQTHDAFTAAIEFGGNGGAGGGEFSARVDARAAHIARGADPRAAVPFQFRRRPVAIAALLAPAAIALAIIANPQDDKRADRAADRAAIDATATTIEAEAERLAAEPGGAAAAERLAALADDLARTDSLERAQELLAFAENDLARLIDDDVLAQKAASQGLARSLENEPLPGARAGAPADQFDQAAAGLESLAPAELDELAERLEQLAESQVAGDPATADALARAAAAVRAGDLSGARAALGEAGAATEATADDVSSQQAAGQARTAVDRAAELLALARDAADGNGAGSGSGQGRGQGSGQGQGQGGGGSPSGNVDGGAGGSSSGGQGGQGQGTGTSGGREDELPDTDTIYDPVLAGDGETGSVGGGQGSGDGGTIGKTDGDTNAGTSRVPVSEAITTYADEATDAVDGAAVPPAVRDVVVNYFDQLQGRD